MEDLLKNMRKIIRNRIIFSVIIMAISIGAMYVVAGILKGSQATYSMLAIFFATLLVALVIRAFLAPTPAPDSWTRIGRVLNPRGFLIVTLVTGILGGLLFICPGLAEYLGKNIILALTIFGCAMGGILFFLPAEKLYDDLTLLDYRVQDILLQEQDADLRQALNTFYLAPENLHYRPELAHIYDAVNDYTDAQGNKIRKEICKHQREERDSGNLNQKNYGNWGSIAFFIIAIILLAYSVKKGYEGMQPMVPEVPAATEQSSIDGSLGAIEIIAPANGTWSNEVNMADLRNNNDNLKLATEYKLFWDEDIWVSPNPIPRGMDNPKFLSGSAGKIGSLFPGVKKFKFTSADSTETTVIIRFY